MADNDNNCINNDVNKNDTINDALLTFDGNRVRSVIGNLFGESSNEENNNSMNPINNITISTTHTLHTSSTNHVSNVPDSTYQIIGHDGSNNSNALQQKLKKV